VGRLRDFLSRFGWGESRSLLWEASYVVRIEEGEVRCTRPDGGEVRVALAELEAVIIETNNTGPWGADFWWQLLGKEQTGCVFPGGATGEIEVTDRLKELPGFDIETLGAAVRSTDNQRFLCWRRARPE
jgi:hypothetical protein